MMEFKVYEDALLGRKKRILFDISSLLSLYADKALEMEGEEFSFFRSFIENDSCRVVIMHKEEDKALAESFIHVYGIETPVFSTQYTDFLDGYIFISKEKTLPLILCSRYENSFMSEECGYYVRSLISCRTKEEHESLDINLVWITDNNYLMPTIVSVESVLSCKSDKDFYHVCIIIAPEVKGAETFKKKLEAKYSQTKVDFIVGRTDIALGKKHNHVSPIAMNKFILPSLLKEFDKVLYIDSDIFVRKDIREMYELKFLGGFCIAVKDMTAMRLQHWERHLEIEGYFNSGIMMFDLNIMRNINIEASLVEFKVKDVDSYYMDQNTLNKVFNGFVSFAHPRYNCMLYNNIVMAKNSIDEYNSFYNVSYPSYIEMLEDSVCIHATNIHKPWLYKDVLFAEFFEDLYKKSIFGEMSLLRMCTEFEHKGERHTLKNVDIRDLVQDPVSPAEKSIPVVISMTSYQKRIHHVRYAVYSLLRQTVRPEKIVLWLGEEQFPGREKDLPHGLLELKDYGLHIRWCEDMRSFTKYIPSLEAFPEAVIVTADDDIFYPPNWLEKLYTSYLQHPEDIHCHRAKLLRVNVPYAQWNITKEEGASYANFLTGVGGCLYPPHIFSNEIFNKDAWKQLTPYADDIWFWAMAVLNNRKIRVVPKCISDLVFTDPVQEMRLEEKNTLASTNVMEGGNDRQLKAVLEAYPDIVEKLNDERPAGKMVKAFSLKKFLTERDGAVVCLAWNQVSKEEFNSLTALLVDSHCVNRLTGQENYACIIVDGKVVSESAHPFRTVKASHETEKVTLEAYAENGFKKRVWTSCIKDGSPYTLESVSEGASITVFDPELYSFCNIKKFYPILPPDRHQLAEVFVSGWHPAEKTLVWSQGQATLRLPSHDAATDYELTFSVFGASEGRPVTAMFYTVIGGVLWQSSVMAENGQDMKVYIPVAREEAREIFILVPQATSPQKLNGSNDARELGIALKNISLHFKEVK